MAKANEKSPSSPTEKDRNKLLFMPSKEALKIIEEFPSVIKLEKDFNITACAETYNKMQNDNAKKTYIDENIKKFDAAKLEMIKFFKENNLKQALVYANALYVMFPNSLAVVFVRAMCIAEILSHPVSLQAIISEGKNKTEFSLENMNKFFKTAIDKHHLPELYFYHAQALMNVGRYNEAKEKFRLFIEKSEGNKDLGQMRIDATMALMSCNFCQTLKDGGGGAMVLSTLIDFFCQYTTLALLKHDSKYSSLPSSSTDPKYYSRLVIKQSDGTCRMVDISDVTDSNQASVMSYSDYLFGEIGTVIEKGKTCNRTFLDQNAEVMNRITAAKLLFTVDPKCIAYLGMIEVLRGDYLKAFKVFKAGHELFPFTTAFIDYMIFTASKLDINDKSYSEFVNELCLLKGYVSTYNMKYPLKYFDVQGQVKLEVSIADIKGHLANFEKASNNSKLANFYKGQKLLYEKKATPATANHDSDFPPFPEIKNPVKQRITAKDFEEMAKLD